MKNKIKTLTAILAAFTIAGCASPKKSQYSEYVKSPEPNYNQEQNIREIQDWFTDSIAKDIIGYMLNSEASSKSEPSSRYDWNKYTGTVKDAFLDNQKDGNSRLNVIFETEEKKEIKVRCIYDKRSQSNGSHDWVLRTYAVGDRFEINVGEGEDALTPDGFYKSWFDDKL